MFPIKPILQTWGRVLRGDVPTLSIEITRECPLRCPGCYAYEDAHLGEGAPNLRSVADFKGEELIRRVLAIVDEYRPLHLSIVGGDPLVRYRELEKLVPQLLERGTYVQLVTSAFRPIPAEWANLKNFHVVVSIDGLQPEHDERRKPATYERILKNIQGQHIVVHCTLVGQVIDRPGYIEEFLKFWSAQPTVRKIWISMFTPQVGADTPECITAEQREHAIMELLRLRELYPKLDMPAGMLKEFLRPPQSPAECIFARTTRTISADLKTEIGPCQFGGNPDCSRCGCIASMGLAAIGNFKLAGPLTAGHIMRGSQDVGRFVHSLMPRKKPQGADAEPLYQIASAD